MTNTTTPQQPEQKPQVTAPAQQNRIPQPPTISPRPENEPVSSLNMEQLRQIENVPAAPSKPEAAAVQDLPQEIPSLDELQEAGTEQGKDSLQEKQSEILAQQAAALTQPVSPTTPVLPSDVLPVTMTYPQAVETMNKSRYTDSVMWLAAKTRRIWKQFNRYLK